MPPLMRKAPGRDRSGSGDASDGRPSAHDRNVCTFRYLFPIRSGSGDASDERLSAHDRNVCTFRYLFQATLPTGVPRPTIGSLARYSTTATLSRVSTSAETAGKVTSPVAAHSTPRLRVS